jgi:hypothetical protein
MPGGWDWLLFPVGFLGSEAFVFIGCESFGRTTVVVLIGICAFTTGQRIKVKRPAD